MTVWHLLGSCRNLLQCPLVVVPCATWNRHVWTKCFQARLCATSSVRTKENVWMQKVLEEAYPGVKLKQSHIKEIGEKIQLLEHLGAKACQLLEEPKILLLHERDIIDRAARLESVGVTGKSVPLIYLAGIQDTAILETKVNTYIDKINGHLSQADFWMHKLECTESQIVKLMSGNKRLQKLKNVSNIVAKVDYLLMNGATTTDVRNHIHVVINKSMATLQTRVTQLHIQGFPLPLPIQIIMQSEAKYREMMDTHREVTAKDDDSLTLHATRPKCVEDTAGRLEDTALLQILEEVNAGEKLTPSYVKEMWEKMQLLEELGCSKYQLLEEPKVLLLDEMEIRKRAIRLRSQGQKKISVPLVHLADVEDAVKLHNKVKAYRDKMNGFLSRGDFWRQKLECTESDVMNLMLKNKRMRNMINASSASTKIDYLLSTGVSLEDIRTHLYVVINKSMKTLKRRTKEVTKLGFNTPLPVQVIMQSESAFRKSVKQKLANEDVAGKMAKLLGVNRERLEGIASLFHLSWSTLKPKLELLLQKGCSVNDILEHHVNLLRNNSLESLKNAFHEIESVGVEKVTVHQLGQLLNTKKLRTQTMKKHVSLKTLAAILGCPVEAVHLHDDATLLLIQQSHILQENMRFLQTCGLDKADVVQCPVILGHDPRILRKFVAEMDFDEFDLANRLDRQKLMNLLQYNIEKGFNFKYTVILKNVMDD